MEAEEAAAAAEAEAKEIEKEEETDVKEIDWDLGLKSGSDDAIKFAEDIVQTNNPSNRRGQRKQSRRQNKPGKNKR